MRRQHYIWGPTRTEIDWRYGQLAEYLGVTEDFLLNAIDRYREKYGPYMIVDKHIIYFDPLGVAKTFE